MATARTWRKWNANTHLFQIGCETCGWQDYTSTNEKATAILERHAQLNHN